MAKKISIIRRLRKKSNISKKSSQVGGSKIKKNTFKKQKRKSKSHIRRKNNKKKYQRSKKNNKKLNFQLGGTEGPVICTTKGQKKRLVKFVNVCLFIDDLISLPLNNSFYIYLNTNNSYITIDSTPPAQEGARDNKILLFTIPAENTLEIPTRVLSGASDAVNDHLPEEMDEWEALYDEADDDVEVQQPCIVARSLSASTDTSNKQVLYFIGGSNYIQKERITNLIEILRKTFYEGADNIFVEKGEEEDEKNKMSIKISFETKFPEFKPTTTQPVVPQPDAATPRLDDFEALLNDIRYNFQLEFLNPGIEHFRIGSNYEYTLLLNNIYNILALKNPAKQTTIEKKKARILSSYKDMHDRMQLQDKNMELSSSQFVDLFNDIMIYTPNFPQSTNKIEALTFIKNLVDQIIIIRRERLKKASGQALSLQATQANAQHEEAIRQHVNLLDSITRFLSNPSFPQGTLVFKHGTTCPQFALTLPP